MTRGKRDVTWCIDRETSRRGAQADRDALALRWPEICEALSKFPPTLGDIEKIKLFGPPEGFSLLPKYGPLDRWDFKTISPRKKP